MASLCTIIHKLINPKIFFNMYDHSSMEYWKDINVSSDDKSEFEIKKPFHLSIQDSFLYMFCSKLFYYPDKEKTFIENKYNFLNEYLNNIFIPETSREKFLELFQKGQRTYFSFSRLAYIYKFKKSFVKINTDMYLNEIQPDKINVIAIMQSGSKYLFMANDLIRIINSSLLNSCHFFPEPLQPKNPFNNLPFDNATLYNIYFFIKYNTFHNPVLFNLFFKSNFNIDDFLYENEPIIRDTYIKNYAKNSPHSVLYHDLKKMLSIHYKYTKKLIIHNDIPKEILINIFRPYFYLYYTFKYGVHGTDKRNTSYVQLKEKLKEFVNFNPQFGRKINKKTKQFVQIKCPETNNMIYALRTIRTFSFNLNHIPFQEIYPNYYNNPEYNIFNTRFQSPSYESDLNELELSSDYDDDDRDNDNDVNVNENDDNENVTMQEEIIAVENLSNVVESEEDSIS